ncbi:major facilitator superfamily domain-containing protein [Penicillium argentinense]|uniref:Major facilitator superfamily domain-containing protein n=1 Tax=Penicillium argentinense TaxID=1131581 RepID=A0A9W9G5U3_9EURO|nr:major facilitator superfamily domain-containing protein [Penicillium argentinense]KAJ5112734.1 major facilitator superfamily domain-containing protein [Penicillium argentinense]
MVWGPISELYGRRMGMLPAMFILGILSIGTLVSQNPAGIFLTHFLGGIFATAPISNVLAGLGDLFDATTRGNAMTVVSTCISGGPTIGPIIGAALTTHHHLGWWGTEYLEAILALVLYALSLYASFTSSLVYLALEVFPIDFREHREWSLVVSTLPFLSILIKVQFSVIVDFANQPHYKRAFAANGNVAVTEAHLPPNILEAILLSADLFWLGWMADPKYTWLFPFVAGGRMT